MRAAPTGVSAVVLAAALLAGCGSDVAVDDALTQDAARTRAVTLAEGVLAALPAGTTLVRQREGDSFSDDDPVGPTGCHPTEFPGADPVAVQAGWTSSAPVGDAAGLLAAVRAGWEQQGWAVTEPRPGAVASTTSTGDVLTVGARPSGVSVRVVTTCFPRDGGPAAPLPSVLPTAGG